LAAGPEDKGAEGNALDKAAEGKAAEDNALALGKGRNANT